MDFRDREGIIVSAERPEYGPHENAERSAAFLMHLLDIVKWNGSVIPVEGCYEGSVEQSYLVLPNDEILKSPAKTSDMTLSILALAHDFSQDAVLVIHPPGIYMLEIPDIEPADGQYSSLDIDVIKDVLRQVYLSEAGPDFLSDRITLVKVDPDIIEEEGLDYTCIDGVYFVQDSDLE